jgi:nitrogen fixation-related uncharacterized protein
MLFLMTGVGNLGWPPLGRPVVFLGSVAVLALLFAVLTRYYNDTYGRVRLATGQQVRFTLISLACFGIPMVAGSILDFRLDLPVSIFAMLFGLGMLIWFAVCIGLRTDQVLVWTALVIVGLVPVWGGFDDRASVGWLPIGVATIIAGVLDHRALARTFGAPQAHVSS